MSSPKSRALVAIVLAAILTACTALGFNERLAYGYSACTAARTTAGTLLDAGSITPDQAERAQHRADAFRAALEAAEATRDLDGLAAALAAIDELTAALTDPARLRFYLEESGP